MAVEALFLPGVGADSQEHAISIEEADTAGEADTELMQTAMSKVTHHQVCWCCYATRARG